MCQQQHAEFVVIRSILQYVNVVPGSICATAPPTVLSYIHEQNHRYLLILFFISPVQYHIHGIYHCCPNFFHPRGHEKYRILRCRRLHPRAAQLIDIIFSILYCKSFPNQENTFTDNAGLYASK